MNLTHQKKINRSTFLSGMLTGVLAVVFSGISSCKKWTVEVPVTFALAVRGYLKGNENAGSLAKAILKSGNPGISSDPDRNLFNLMESFDTKTLPDLSEKEIQDFLFQKSLEDWKNLRIVSVNNLMLSETEAKILSRL